MSKNIWYLPGPFHRYEQNVKALANEAGVTIIDSTLTSHRSDAAKDVPEVTLKPAFRRASMDDAEGDSDVSKWKVDELRAKLLELEVAIPEGSKKPELVALLQKALAGEQ